jgi:spore maturation protein A
VLNYIWLALVVLAVAIGGWNNRLSEVTAGAFDGAKTAVTIALGLIGIMALWLGVMRLAERAGLVQKIARGLRPVMRRLFPDVPPEHPAMGSMLMNMAANMLGLGNAATPLGLRAMRDLERLNPRPGVASNAMCTFLAINTASVQLIPATAIALLASAGSTLADGDRGYGTHGHLVRRDGCHYRSQTPGEAAVLPFARSCSRDR